MYSITIEELKAYRAHLGLTQHAMAERLGVGKRHYEKLESGDAPIAELIALKIMVELNDVYLRPVWALLPKAKRPTTYRQMIEDRGGAPKWMTGLSARTIHALMAADWAEDQLKQAIAEGEDLTGIPNLGKRGIEEIKRWLAGG